MSNEGYEWRSEDETETLTVEFGPANGLRINVENDDIDDIAHFHIRSREEAECIAESIVLLAKRRWP